MSKLIIYAIKKKHFQIRISKINSRSFQENPRSFPQSKLHFYTKRNVLLHFCCYIFKASTKHDHFRYVCVCVYVCARVCLPREIIPHVHLASAADTPCMYAGRVCRQRTLERHSVVITFAIRPRASYWRLLFDLNIFFRAKLAEDSAR